VAFRATHDAIISPTPVNTRFCVNKCAAVCDSRGDLAIGLRLGGQIYFSPINDTGGVNGQKIRVLAADDAYKVDETARLTKEALANPEVVALFGFAGTANVGKLLSEGILEQGGAAWAAPYTGGKALRSPFNPWIFHVRAGYADETEHMV